LALALGTGAYSLVVGAYALRNHERVVSDLGSASISLYGIIVAVVLAATSLYRELELKTLFPILARPVGRSEYLVGKYLGTLLTMAVFIAANSGALLIALGAMVDRPIVLSLAVVAVIIGATVITGYKFERLRVFVPLPMAFALLATGWLLASGAPDDRRVIVGAAALTLLEVAIVAAMATLFASFSSPFLTAVFTFSLFLVGRSADTLAHLPKHVFGEVIQRLGEWLSAVVPNLMFYVPPRSLLTGEAADQSLQQHLLLAAAQAAGWVVGLLCLASLVFKRRDFL
jgi:ABC-type transport system involved in multi-copper enzyme maturation permease subunit